MDAVLESPIRVELPGLPRLTTLFRTFGRWLMGSALTSEDTARLVEIADAARVVGQPVLEARDRADLDDRIDQAVALPEFYETLGRLLGAARSASRGGPAEFVTGPAAAERLTTFLLVALGPGALQPLLRGVQYLSAILEAAKGFKPETNSQENLLEFIRRSRQEPLWFLTDPKGSVESARAALHLIQWFVCLLAMVELLLRREKIEPWTALALAERWERDLYVVLRYVASVPGVDVPDDLVPLSDRLDLSRAEINAGRARAEADDLFRQAKESAAPVWPPLNERPIAAS